MLDQATIVLRMLVKTRVLGVTSGMIAVAAVASSATTISAGAVGDDGPCDLSNEPWIYPAEAEDVTDPVSWA